MTSLISDLNQEQWSSAKARFTYRKASDLFPAEVAILDSLRDRIGQWKVLDIGVGTGRTTEHVAPVAGHYIGLDYSKSMLAQARRRFPDCDLREADARKLDGFEDGAFDFVLFSFNGIDYISDDDRRAALSEIHRVLKSGGLYFFSSHNLDYKGLQRHPCVRVPAISAHPLKMLKRVVSFAESKVRSRWLAGRTIISDEYAILNDDELNHSLLTYYIRKSHQIKQLAEAGFGATRVFRTTGETVDRDDAARDQFMLHYLTVRQD